MAVPEMKSEDLQPGPVTLNREQLYELVWSEPIQRLAAKFGLSDVGLAKNCRAMHIPLPPRGYWARLRAGQKPAVTPYFRAKAAGVSDGGCRGAFRLEDG